MIKIKRYGYRPSLKDPRNYKFLRDSNVVIPESVDLRSKMPLPPFDQGNLGSCAENALVGALVFDQVRQLLPVEMMSRLYVYYFTRLLQGDTSQDTGSDPVTMFKAYNGYGVCPEYAWPYDVNSFAYRPGVKKVQKGKAHAKIVYSEVPQTSDDLLGALAQGQPVIYGFSVQESFESNQVAQTGLYYPAASEAVIGGHAVLALGYSQSMIFPNGQKGGILTRNSWGATGWGIAGHFWIPIEDVLDPNITSDLWVLKQVS